MKTPDLKGAVLLGAAAEHEAVKLFKRNFAAPWEILRYRVEYRDHSVEETVEPGVLLVRVTDTLVKRRINVTLKTTDIATATREKSILKYMQSVSDSVRSNLAADAAVAYHKAAILDRFKARRKARRAKA